MKLKTVDIQEFRSIRDTQPFDVGQVTCLVGKNESGKSSVLQALYRLNPVIDERTAFNVTEDYPRAYVKRYERALKAKEVESQNVVTAVFSLEPADLADVEKTFGAILPKKELELRRGYDNQLRYSFETNEALAVSTAIQAVEVPTDVRENVLQNPEMDVLIKALAENSESITRKHTKELAAANAMAEDSDGTTAKADAIAAANAIKEPKKTADWRTWLDKNMKEGMDAWIWARLQPRIPKFLYFDEYFQMEGHVNIPALKQRQEHKQLLESDRPMLGLIDLADLQIDQLVTPPNTQDLINNLEGASNDLTRQIMPYWSQNRHIGLRFDIRSGASGDP